MNYVNVKKLIASFAICVVMPFSLCAADTSESEEFDFIRLKCHGFTHRVMVSRACGAKKSCNASSTRFSIERSAVERRLENIIHPILHGKVSNPSFFGKVCGFVWNFAKKQVKTIACGALSLAAPNLAQIFFHNGFFSESSSSSPNVSLEMLSKAEDEVKKEYPKWNSHKDCPKGMRHCPHIGNNSKQLLQLIYFFLDNITEYEKRVGKSYFSDGDIDRVFIHSNQLLSKIAEHNILHQDNEEANKKGSVPDDTFLKSDIKIMDYLIALPTESTDVAANWQKNKLEIDKLLDFLPDESQDSFYDYMRKLRAKALDPEYGHRDGDTGINLLLSGPTGAGKTFTALGIMSRLGFTPIRLTFKELMKGQDNSINELSDLHDGSEFSGVETKVLRLKNGKKKGIATLNQMIVVDEVDEDYISMLGQLKEQRDQFRRFTLPVLGLTLPGFINIVFTTNKSRLFSDPALCSRFTQIPFPAMAEEKKEKILYDYLLSKVKHQQELKDTYNEAYFADVVKTVVQFDKRLNIRILIDNIDGVLCFLDTKREVQKGNDYLLPPGRRGQDPENLEAYLNRTLGRLDLEFLEDSNEKDYSSDELLLPKDEDGCSSDELKSNFNMHELEGRSSCSGICAIQ